MSTIGCAEEYIVRIEETLTLPMMTDTGALTGNIEPIHELPWSAIEWGRVENDVSRATITVANDPYGTTMCPYPLHGWKQSIGIYRNGTRVWWGPIIAWGNAEDDAGSVSVQITAHDIFAFLKRPGVTVIADIDMTTYPALIISQIIQDIGGLAYGAVPLSFLYSNMDPAYTDITQYSTWGPLGVVRTILATTHTPAWSAILDILAEVDGRLSAVAFLGYIKARSANRQLPSEGAADPVLNEFTVLNKPRLTVECTEVASYFWMINDNAGEGGYASSTEVISLLSGYTDPVTGVPFNNFYAWDTPFVPGLWLPTYMPAEPRSDDANALIAGYNPAIKALAPNTTIEALALREAFGAPDKQGQAIAAVAPGFAGINDLVPGMFVARWGFDQDCLSGVPVTNSAGNYELPATYYQNDMIRFVRLVQLDVTVTKDDSGLTETIAASFVPEAVTNSG